MAGPNYGALGATFKAVRALQAICMVVIIGLAANFISQIVSSNQTAPQELVGTISVVSALPDPQSPIEPRTQNARLTLPTRTGLHRHPLLRHHHRPLPR